MNQVTTQPEGKSISARALSIVAGVVILAIAAPVIWMAVSAGLGLAALGLIGVGFVGALQAIPLMGQKWENHLIKARKAEARANPIEQQQNNARHRAQQINETRKALSAINGQIESMRDMITDRRREDPNYDFTRQERSLAKMVQFYQVRVTKLGRAQKALEEYNKMIERNIFDWEFAKKGRIALENMNASDKESVMNEILSNEANRSVQDEFNAVCADLDNEVLELNSAKQISFDDGMYLDMSAVQIPVAVKA